jgi:hypothetical protein
MQYEVHVKLHEIRAHETNEPFRPFRLCLSDGSEHEVWNPNLLMLTRHTVILGVMKDGQDFPDHAVYLDLIHITRVETIDEESIGDGTS